MVSDLFEIDLPYLSFRIGGGAHEGKTCLNLVVGDKVVRTATGRNDEKLEPRVWAVREFAAGRRGWRSSTTPAAAGGTSTSTTSR